MRWAFWRRDVGEQAGAAEPPTDPPAEPPALPDDIGLPTRRPHPAAPAGHDGDEPSGGSAGPRTASSGASPDAAEVQRRRRVLEPAALAVEGDHLDEDLLPGSGPRLAALVDAVLKSDARSLETAMAAADLVSTRTAGAAAVGVLATRLPALSGVDGAVVFDEDEEELLHAYADLLVERCEARRARLAPQVPREDLMVVAHLAAATAIGDAAAEPTLLVLPGLPAASQLLAAGLLLAQTAQDGAGGPDAVAGEVTDLFG